MKEQKKQRRKNTADVIPLRPYNVIRMKNINLLLYIKKFDGHDFFPES